MSVPGLVLCSPSLPPFICRSCHANKAHVQCLCVHVRDRALTPGQVRKIISYRLCRTELDEELGALPRQLSALVHYSVCGCVDLQT